MGADQKGFKSTVYRMNIQKMKRTTRSQLRKGDRLWGGRQAMGKSSADEQKPHRRPTGWEELAQHSESGRAVRSNALGDSREVSRGHSTAIENRGAGIRPFKLGNPPARSGKDRTDTMGLATGHPSAGQPRPGVILRAEKSESGREREPVRKRRCSARRGGGRSLPQSEVTGDVSEPPCYGPVWPVVWVGVQISRLPE